MLEMLDRLEKEEVQNSDSNSGNLLDIIICYKNCSEIETFL